MKIVFFGTPDYVLPVSNLLHKTFKSKAKTPILAVVTQKPKPAGRKRKLKFSPVDAWAHKKKVPIYYQAKDLIEKGIEADFGVLAAYGEIIPKEVIDLFPNGILNIHPSLLPKFRGASPVQATIVAGEKQTGVTIIKLDEELDHGPIISQFTEDVRPEDTTGSLRSRLFEKSAEVTVTLLPSYIKGKITLREQDHEKATYTTLLKKSHGFIPPEFFKAAIQGKIPKKKWEMGFMKDFKLTPDPYSLERFIRAMDPWPIAWTKVKTPKEKKLRIISAYVEEEKFMPKVVQLEGKNEVSWKQFKEGYPQASL